MWVSVCDLFLLFTGCYEVNLVVTGCSVCYLQVCDFILLICLIYYLFCLFVYYVCFAVWCFVTLLLGFGLGTFGVVFCNCLNCLLMVGFG